MWLGWLRRSCPRNAPVLARPIGLSKLLTKHLSDIAQRQWLGGKNDLAWLFCGAQTLAHQIYYLGLRDLCSGLDTHHCKRRFTPFFMGHAKDRDLEYTGMVGNYVFDFGGIDIENVIADH